MQNKIKLYGDGIHDDTEAIQALLNNGVGYVKLPPAKVHYRISRPLMLHSNQELALDRFTVIRLAPQSNCYMLTNDDHEDGNVNIAVTGGIWDYNNLEQSPNYQLAHRLKPALPGENPSQCNYNQEYCDGFYRGVAFLFVNVTHFTMQGLTLRNPVTYGAQFAKLQYFTLEDITFDYKTWNPAPNNMDGVHFDGGCRFGRIANLKGTCYDDLVALNANDGLIDSPFQGPISDIDIDGIFSENCHSAVRMLSFGAAIKRINIRNVYGTFYRYTVGITHWSEQVKEKGVFDDIRLENFFVGKAHPHPDDFNTSFTPEYPMIFLEPQTRVGKLIISNLQREEHTVAIPTIYISENSEVEWLSIRDSGCRNRLEAAMDFLVNEGQVGQLFMQNNILLGSSSRGKMIAGNGHIKEII